MSSSKPRRYLFISYAREDEASVREFLNFLSKELKTREVPVDIWQDVDQLQPGVSWQSAIRDALNQSIGLLVFVSNAAMSSAFVRQELEAMLSLTDRLIVPVILEHVTYLPPKLRARQWLDLSTAVRDPSRLHAEAARLAEVIAGNFLSFGDRPPLTERMAAKLADFAASTIRKVAAPIDAGTSTPIAPSVFVVHGHNSDTRDLVCTQLRNFGIEPIVLSQQLGQSQSLLQKFLKVSERANFAVVVLSSDDYGASLVQYDAPGVADRALKFRARQNVILELGFFYGRLGWENVFVLQPRPLRVFPDFERPSDLAGAVFDEIDSEGLWRSTLAERLRSAGFDIRFPGMNTGQT